MSQKIRIAFQSFSAAQFPASEVYHKLVQEPNVDTKVIVSPLNDRDKEGCLDSYIQTLNWFKENKYEVIEGLNIDTMQFATWEDIGFYPDILFQVSSWFTSMPQCQWFSELSLNTLMIYIPYSIYLADSQDKKYSVNMIYNKEMTNLMWRVYCDSAFNLSGYKKYQLLKGKNVRYSGYTKMDYFYKTKNSLESKVEEIWKCPVGRDIKEYKRVIICPHYTVGNDNFVIQFSTFQKNMWFWPYLAQKYEDRVSFIFKPHPSLKVRSIQEGLFKSYDEYDEYIKKWDSLPNACVVQDAGYLDCFATSDAMIMDSVSFLVEYLYTGKPLLFLTRPEQAFLEIGERVKNVYYRASGENYAEIEAFLNKVVLGNSDDMKEQREKLLDEDYNYVRVNGVSASDYVCQDVLGLLKGE